MEPNRIDHFVEIIGAGTQIDQVYNYLVYSFEGPDAYVWARAYLDDIQTVTIHGPFKSAEDRRPVEHPELMQSVIDYLKQRFGTLKTLRPNGEVTLS